MTDYGKGQIITSATVLPTTSAVGLFFGNALHPIILTGFIIVNVFWFLILVSQISRFLLNRSAK